LLRRLGAEIVPAYETLLDRAAALRPILIEAQRRLDRRDIEAESFQLEEGRSLIDAWIAKSSELAEQREELLRQVGELVDRVESDLQAFKLVQAPDPETARTVKRIVTTLGALQEATAVLEEQVQRMQEARAEEVATEVIRLVEEWKARRSSVEEGAKRASADREDLAATATESETLVPPRREDVPTGDGLSEVRETRRDVELAGRMIAYFENELRLFEKANLERQTLLKSVEELSTKQGLYTRQVARLYGALAFAAQLVTDGTLPDWNPPTGVSLGGVWDSWRLLQVAELERLDLADVLRAQLVDEEAMDKKQAQIEKERENQRQAETRLNTELSYAEFVSGMMDQADAELLVLLSPEGEIAKNLADAETEIPLIQAQIASVSERCVELVRATHALENPYSRAVVRERGKDLDAIRAQLENLKEGELPADESEMEAATGDSAIMSFPEALMDSTDITAAELAEGESKYLRKEQQQAAVFLEHNLSLEASLAELRKSIAERRRLDAELEAQLTTRLQEEKRRYAAAREIRRRIDENRLEEDALPPDVESILSRKAIGKINDELRTSRSNGSRFYERADYEVTRLEQVTEKAVWWRLRSEAADARLRLVGRPVLLLTSALTPLDRLSDVERKNLEYDAHEAEQKEGPISLSLLATFTSDEERRRFEEPLRVYYLELANTHRITRDLNEAEAAYGQMTTNCLAEERTLQPAKEVFHKSVARCLLDYQATRHAAAVAAHPVQQARLEEAFRGLYGSDLVYRLTFQEGDLDLATDLLFGAKARLIAARRLAKDVELFLSKIGLEQEIGWYLAQRARIGSLLEVQRSREEDLRRRIDRLRGSYRSSLKTNVIERMGIAMAILVFAFLSVRLLHRFARRFEARIANLKGEDAFDRQRRMQTISQTSAGAISVLVWTLAIIYVFAQLGLDITPIVASASVLGLAVAFGAQALIKDFFYGFFILIENQFTIGDVVTLGTIGGTVERISLRITVLRDLEGVAHYIPNGSIGQVSNKTQGWSRVVMEISVALKEDPDYAARVLGEVLLEMAGDPEWRSDITEEPVVAGVESVTERSVDIRVMIKTRPGKQWGVAREARRRIKRRFDKLGIEIPFPHRVVHHVYERGKASPGARGSTSKKR